MELPGSARLNKNTGRTKVATAEIKATRHCTCISVNAPELQHAELAAFLQCNYGRAAQFITVAHFVFPFSKFTSHVPFCTSTFQINLFATMRCTRSDDATAHQRIVDNGHTQKNTCAEPWGCLCCWEYCWPDCAANLPRQHFSDPGGLVGCGGLKRAAGQAKLGKPRMEARNGSAKWKKEQNM